MKWIKQLLRHPTPLELATKELNELEHSKLKATAEREWAYHRIKYTEQRIGFLQTYIEDQVQPQSQS